MQNQLGQLTNSISVVEMHINTIEGSELNKSILQTLKASGDALRRMGVEGGGIEGVEKIVSEVETQMEYASEITKVISAGNVAGTINSMGSDVFTDEELEQELEDLLAEDVGRAENAPKPLHENSFSSEHMPPRPERKKNGVGAALRVPVNRPEEQNEPVGKEEEEREGFEISSTGSSAKRSALLI